MTESKLMVGGKTALLRKLTLSFIRLCQHLRERSPSRKAGSVRCSR